MSQWQHERSSSFSSDTRDFLQNLANSEDGSANASAEVWAPKVRASSFHFDPNQFAHFGPPPSEHPLATRFELPTREEAPLAARLELHGSERLETTILRDARELPLIGKDNSSSTPLSQIYNILDVHSDSSRWLEQRGYLNAFKSPDCTLDLNFSTDARGSKVGAVMTAPDGSKRTIVACEGGTTFQRLTAPGGQELVKFLSTGQIVEINPSLRNA